DRAGPTDGIDRRGPTEGTIAVRGRILAREPDEGTVPARCPEQPRHPDQLAEVAVQVDGEERRRQAEALSRACAVTTPTTRSWSSCVSPTEQGRLTAAAKISSATAPPTLGDPSKSGMVCSGDQMGRDWMRSAASAAIT